LVGWRQWGGGTLPVDAPQVGIIWEVVVRFQERADLCSRLEAAGQESCNLVLGPAGNPNILVVYLEEAAGPPGLVP
jgi:hypothetical protein